MMVSGLLGWLPIFAQPKSWQAKILVCQIKVAKVRAKKIGVHFVDCQNEGLPNVSFMGSLRTF